MSLLAQEIIGPDICEVAFSTPPEPMVKIPEWTLRPMRRRIAVVSCHPSRLAEIRQRDSSGVLWVPENSDTQPLPGIVVGVAAGVKGVEFGDAVMLPSWDKRGSMWFNSPFLHLGGVYGKHAAGRYCDCRSEYYVDARGDDKLVFLDSVSDLLWRIADDGAGPTGDMWAVGGRIIAKFRPMAEATDSGLATPNYIRDTPAVAQVHEVRGGGTLRYGISRGDWILVPRHVGTRITYHDLGEEWISLLARDVCAVWKTEPGEIQWIK